jgi:hypothetical protein
MSVTMLAISTNKDRAYVRVGYDIYLVSPNVKGGLRISSEDELRIALDNAHYVSCNEEFEYLHQVNDIIGVR